MLLNNLKNSPAAGLARAVLDVLLPPRCAGTGDIVDAPGMVSAAFWPQLAFIESPLCITCGLPFNFEAPEGTLCAVCMEDEPAYTRARAAVIYNDASRDIILGFKYGDRLHAVQTFTPWLVRAGAEMLAETDIILPVPLHPRRLWQRRFNQSALLAEALAQRAGKAYLPDTLRRLRHTVPQKGLSRKERLNNVKNAFGLHGSPAMWGKNALLVDDVYTSGATLNACTRVLKKAGAENVFVLTIARVTRDEF